jgi:hypothetical protein
MIHRTIFFEYLLLAINVLIVNYFASAVQFTVNITNGIVQNHPVQIYFASLNLPVNS